jgi:tRNA U34 2-thiouridine synthase MnmA/TrmU
MGMTKPVQGIGLVSGGLDSLLAVAVLKRSGVDILGVHFDNGFSPGSFKRRIERGTGSGEELERKIRHLTEILGVPVRGIDVSEEFLDLLVAPRHGYGANVNPCIDCRIFLLKKARIIMEQERADFVFTGEVLGQRPMSQHRRALDLVERASGLEGRLLRPLCAKLLPVTIPERDGRIDRASLLDIQGRSRRRQMELARDLGITDYAQPAGGCTLTDEHYARKFNDLMAHRDRRSLTREEATLLAIGRHFRLSSAVKLVVGRNQVENLYLERAWGNGLLAVPVDHPGPTVLIQGEPEEREVELAASIAARYSNAKHAPGVRVQVKGEAGERIVTVPPASDGELDRYRI